MRCKRLSDLNSYQMFSKGFFNSSGIHVESGYLQQSFVRGLYDHSGQIVGGYVLNQAKPFRYLSRAFVREEHLNSPKLPDLNQTAEITCIWVNRDVSTPERVLIGLYLVKDCMACGKKYFMGGSFNKKIMMAQKKALPHDIFAIQFVDATSGAPGIHYFYYGTVYTLVTGVPRWLAAKLYKKMTRFVAHFIFS